MQTFSVLTKPPDNTDAESMRARTHDNYKKKHVMNLQT